MVHRASTLSNGEGETFDCRLKLTHRFLWESFQYIWNPTLHACIQLLQYVGVFTINSYLPWPHHSASQELYLDLPADNSAPDDSEDEKVESKEVEKDGEDLERDLRDRVRQVPIPSHTTTPVVPTLAESEGGNGNPGVLENDQWVPEALPVDEQECVFGLHKKIMKAKARIAELKGQNSSSTGTPIVSPSDPVPEIPSPVDPTSSRAAEIRSRIEKLQSDLKFLVSTIDQFPSL